MAGNLLLPPRKWAFSYVGKDVAGGAGVDGIHHRGELSFTYCTMVQCMLQTFMIIPKSLVV